MIHRLHNVPQPLERQAYGQEDGGHAEYCRARRAPADSPDDGGPLPGELGPLLRALVRSPRCVGLNITVYDPDPDPDGTAGALLTDLVVAAFAEE